MRFRVRLLRNHGRRLRWQDVLNGPSYVGDLRTYLTSGDQRVKAATLISLENQRAILPDLYEPALLGFSIFAIRLRGFERLEGPDGPYAVVQEWHCEMP
jgi:hypothetical protein